MSSTQSDQNAYAATTPPAYGNRADESSTAYGSPARTGRNGLGIAALVLGILSIVLCLAWYVAVVLGILGVTFGIIGRGRAQRGEASNRGMATAGLVTGIIGIVASIAVFCAVVAFANSSTGKCIVHNQGNNSAQQQCLK